MVDIVKQILVRPIQLADQVIKMADEVALCKQECLELKAKTSKLSDLLRQAARSSSDLYERPTRRIIDDTEQVLEKAVSLVHKCRAHGFLKRAFTIIPTAAFRKMFSLVENSIGDVSWLLRVSAAGDSVDGGGCGGSGYLGLPPIAANEPILCLIWEQIATLSIGSVVNRADAAASLVSLAGDNDRYGKLIIEEGGVGPLLKLVKEGKTVEGQENAARAIGLLGRDPESVEHMVHAGVCSVFAKVLKEGSMKVQAVVAWAVAELASHYPKCQDIFAQHNVVRLLVGHLAFETVQEHIKYAVVATHKTAAKAVAIAAEAVVLANSNPNNGHLLEDEDRDHPQIPHPMGMMRGQNPSKLHNLIARVQAQTKSSINGGHGQDMSNGHNLTTTSSKTKEREMEDPETKSKMKSMAARALWHLAKGNSAICKNICESRALLCFAVLLEKGTEEIKNNSAMALMEITGVAEKDADLRRSAFKPNSPACKTMVDQLLRIIEKGDSNSNSNSNLLVPCIKAIGHLAKTFRVTETGMIGPLVHLLDEKEAEVSKEAAIALAKFSGSENYLGVDHSKAIISAGGIKHLVQLVYFGEQIVQIPALVLLTNIALQVPDGEELAQNEVLKVLEWASKQPHLVQDDSRHTLLIQAQRRLELYQSRGSFQVKK